MAKKKQQLIVQETVIGWQTIDQKDYINLTDIARKFNDRTDIVMQNWLRNPNTVEFLITWEQMNNPNFNPMHLHGIREESGLGRFVFSVKQWVEEYNAIGLVSKAGRYGGTWGHTLIAYEFASFLSPSFKLYILQEFDRLKAEEADLKNLEWNANRFLTKRNYALQTEAIKQNLLPQSTEPPEKDWITYANEADILNMALFSTTAAAWRTANPKAAKKGENIRDHASNIHLIVLSNLEAINAEFIKEGLSKDERFARLKDAAIFQLGIFYRDKVGLE